MSLPGWIKAIFMAAAGIEQQSYNQPEQSASQAALISPHARRRPLHSHKSCSSAGLEEPDRTKKKKKRQLWLFASLHLCLTLNQEHTDGCHAPSKLHRRTPTDGLTRSGPFLILRALHGQIHAPHLDSRTAVTAHALIMGCCCCADMSVQTCGMFGF